MIGAVVVAACCFAVNVAIVVGLNRFIGWWISAHWTGH